MGLLYKIYNHKLKQVKFNHFKSKFSLKKNNTIFFVLENQNFKEKKFKKLQLKKSFLFSHFSEKILKKKNFVGSGAIFKIETNFEKEVKDKIQFLKDKSCLIAYNNIYWTLNKILTLSLEKNNQKILVGLLLNSLKNTVIFFSPLKYLLSNLKLESSKK